MDWLGEHVSERVWLAVWDGVGVTVRTYEVVCVGVLESDGVPLAVIDKVLDPVCN